MFTTHWKCEMECLQLELHARFVRKTNFTVNLHMHRLKLHRSHFISGRKVGNKFPGRSTETFYALCLWYKAGVTQCKNDIAAESKTDYDMRCRHQKELNRSLWWIPHNQHPNCTSAAVVVEVVVVDVICSEQHITTAFMGEVLFKNNTWVLRFSLCDVHALAKYIATWL